MIPAFMVAAALGASAPALAAPERTFALEELCELRVELFVEVGPRRFQVKNPTDTGFVLLFGSPRHGLIEATLLEPGAGLDVRVPEGGFDGLWLEILGRGEDRWVQSGAMALSELGGNGGSSLWVQRTDAELIPWLSDRDGFDPVRSIETLLPDDLPRPTALPAWSELESPRERAQDSPLHVPVIDPKERPKEGPPPVEEKPLPPV